MDSNKDEQSSFHSVNHQLRHMTALYLQNHPTLTLNALATRSGVPATTLRRLMQTEAALEPRGEIAPHTVLALVSYILREKKISHLLKKLTGPVADFLSRSFDQFIFDEESDHKIDPGLNQCFKDKTSYLIYKLAANVCGTSVEEIKNCFGLHGLKNLNMLMEAGHIKVDSCGKLHAAEKNFSVDLALAHQLTHALLDQYKPADVGAGFSLFYSLSEGMNADGIKKIKEIEKDAVKKIFEIMNDEKWQGEIPYFAVVLSDVIGATPQSDAQGVLQ